MVLLNISSLFRTILIILVIYYGIKFLVRYVFPMLLKNYMENKMKELKKQQGIFEQEAEQIKKQEGKVTISQNPSKDGEYVDYEEVK